LEAFSWNRRRLGVILFIAPGEGAKQAKSLMESLSGSVEIES
jgi:hypothetical protein